MGEGDLARSGQEAERCGVELKTESKKLYWRSWTRHLQGSCERQQADAVIAVYKYSVHVRWHYRRQHKGHGLCCI